MNGSCSMLKEYEKGNERLAHSIWTDGQMDWEVVNEESRVSEIHLAWEAIKAFPTYDLHARIRRCRRVTDVTATGVTAP